MNRAHLCAAVILLASAACTDRQPLAPPPASSPVFAISDGHNGGNPGFFFLAPIRRLSDDATVPTTGFNPALSPVIEVYECAGTSATGCVLPLGALKSRITSTSGTPLLNRLYVLPRLHEYGALWDTRNLGLRTDRTYRIQVSVGGALLGFADVDVVRTISEAVRVNRDEFVPLLQQLILPIRFWVGNGALCASGGTPCAAGTVNLATGGGIELLGGGEDFKFDIPSGTTATFGGQPVKDVTFNLAVCSGIDVDLPRVGACLRVATFFDGPGGSGELVFSRPILISLCVLNGEIHNPDETRQEGLLTLHQQDGAVIRALPHASPNCNTIGMRFWNRVKNLAARVFAPRPAMAASRNALLHVGGGGETDRTGATCPPPGSAIVPTGMFLVGACPPASPTRSPGGGPNRSPTATITPPHTVSDFQFALPAMMDFVDPDDASRSAPPGTSLSTAVKVTDWDGNAVQGAHVTFLKPAIEGLPTILGTATSNSDGIAAIAWTIETGSNTAVATGRGIAAQNNYPNATVKPFMPDISLPTTQQEAVFLGNGRVTFLATGAQADNLDQQNLLDGELGGQGIGRFSDITGAGDPNGTAYDLQDAQSFTVGASGQLTQIKVPLVNTNGATIGVTMQIVPVVDGVPDDGHSLGQVTIPASAISSDLASRFNPAAWATFDLRGLGINVVSGQVLAFTLSSLSDKAYLYNPEFSPGYAGGEGFRRNRALTTTWSAGEVDFGFQTFGSVVIIP